MAARAARADVACYICWLRDDSSSDRRGLAFKHSARGRQLPGLPRTAGKGLQNNVEGASVGEQLIERHLRTSGRPAREQRKTSVSFRQPAHTWSAAPPGCLKATRDFAFRPLAGRQECANSEGTRSAVRQRTCQHYSETLPAATWKPKAGQLAAALC